MVTYTSNTLTIHFGTQQTGFAPKQFYSLPTQAALCNQPQFSFLKNKQFITLAQTHSAVGYHITPEIAQQYTPYSLEGDYIITPHSSISLGVATADCLPIILYDSIKHVLAVIHAGWRGSAAGITHKALTDLQQLYACSLADILVFFGPAARSCCYEIQPDFLTYFTPNPVGLITRDQKLFFDVSAYNKAVLMHAGVPAQNINQEYNRCTICNIQFCSHRRDGAQAQRQMTIAYLTYPE